MSIRSLALAGLLAVAATVSQAATVVSEAGTFAGGTDFVSSGGGALVGAANAAYVPNSATSQWVWDADLSLSEVTFAHTFDLTGHNHTAAVLSGFWAADNIGFAYLNGIEIASLSFGKGAFNTLNAFGAATGFVEGLNTLEFRILNKGPSSASNPAAFRAEALVTVVPLPAGGLLIVTGLCALGAMGRRRKAG